MYSDIERRGLLLLGCGKMGSAMLAGWLASGVSPTAVWVIDPNPSDWVRGQGVHINVDLPESPAIVIVAVKPQMMGAALPSLQALGNSDTVFLSIAAGTSIATFETILGDSTPIVRAMPNTPAAIGQGITAMIGNTNTDANHLQMAENLLSAIGQVVQLDAEQQMDAVTGVSGSGPAYVFYMIDVLAQAGVAQGLSPELAMQLAKATVSGAGALAQSVAETPTQLRINVTSPNGTTQAGLEVLMQDATGLAPLIKQTVAASADRSRELANG
jgi:pyrroline-5-carboxylate reductase